MVCRLCESNHLSRVKAEIALHFPGLKNIDKPVVWVFPEVWVCLNCGTSEFSVTENQLLVLSIGNAAVTDSVPLSPPGSLIEIKQLFSEPGWTQANTERNRQGRNS
jgi:hypothetical protein